MASEIKYSDTENENKILDNLVKSGTIDAWRNQYPWSGWDLPNTCLRLFTDCRWNNETNQSENYWYIATLRYTIVQKTFVNLKDFPSPDEVIKLHKQGLEQNEVFSNTPDC